MSRTAIIILVVGILILGGIGATIFVLNQPQDTRSRATFPTPTLGFPSPTAVTTPALTPIPTETAGGIGGGAGTSEASCTAPTQAQNVLVEFPGCEGDNCLFTQASCSWDPNADATNYNITVTEVETGSVVRNETIPNSTTKVLFPITQGRTYKCDVSVVNSCGSVSAVSTDQLLCEADALIPTATPVVTPAPIASASPTLAPTTPPTTAATPTPTPTLQPGGIIPTAGIIGGILLLIVGGIVFLAL